MSNLRIFDCNISVQLSDEFSDINECLNRLSEAGLTNVLISARKPGYLGFSFVQKNTCATSATTTVVTSIYQSLPGVTVVGLQVKDITGLI